MKSGSFVFTFAIALLACIPAMAQFTQINYQGHLYDDQGDPISGVLTVAFFIYDAESAGTELWTENQVVSFTNGLFTVQLGTAVPFNLNFNQDYWLEIRIGGDAFTPRQPLVSVAYAMNAKDVYNRDIHPSSVSILGYGEVIDASGNWVGVVGGNDTQLLYNDGGVQAGAELFYDDATGNLGIGETNPQAKLHVGGTPGTDGIMFPDGTTQTTAASGGVPSGYMILGTTSTPPADYTYVGEFSTGNTWKSKMAMPTSRSGLGAASVNGKIYAIGGSPTTAANEEYDPATNSWTTLPPMSVARYGLVVVADESAGHVYAIGGRTTTYTGLNERYDVAAGTWTAMAPMPTARQYGAAALVNNRIYVMGGFNGASLAVNEEYDITGNAWSTVSSIPVVNNNFSAGVVNGVIYTFGRDVSPYNSVYQYQPPPINSWTAMSPMPTGRRDLAAAVVNDTIYVMGGYDGVSYSGILDQYDPATNVWERNESMPTARCTLAAAAVGGKIYALGGSTGTVSGINEEYDPNEMTLYVHMKN